MSCREMQWEAFEPGHKVFEGQSFETDLLQVLQDICQS